MSMRNTTKLNKLQTDKDLAPLVKDIELLMVHLIIKPIKMTKWLPD